jgi:aminopeptidase N
MVLIKYIAYLLIFLPSFAFASEYSDLLVQNIPDLKEKNDYFLKENIFRQFLSKRQIVMKKLRALPFQPNYYSIKHTDFTASIDHATGTMDAESTIEVAVLTDGSKDLLLFLDIDTVSVSDAIGPLDFKQKKQYGVNTLTITLREPLNEGSQISLKVVTHGVPNCEAGGALNVFSCLVGKEITLGGFDLMLPTGIYGDFATMSGKINIPSDYVLVTTGIMENVEIQGNNITTCTMEQPYPTQLHAFVLGQFINFSSEISAEKYIKTFFPSSPQIEKKSDNILQIMKGSIDLYSNLFGEFIYPKLDSAYIPNDTGASFGYPSMIMIVEGVFKGGQWEMGSTFSHEIAHQWFGNILKPDWYNSGAWLSEGFAEFSSVIYSVETMFANEPENKEKMKQNRFRNYQIMYQYYVSPEKDQPVSKMDGSSSLDPMVYMIVTYYKGAMIVNMMRNLFGDDQFYQAMKLLAQIYAGKNLYYSEKQLKEVLETVYMDKLDWFFNEWVEGAGYPIYKIGVENKEISPSKYQVSVSFRNENSIQTTPFKMPVDVVTVTENEEKVHTEIIENIDQKFVYEVDSRPVRVKIDPDFKIIRRTISKLEGDLNISGEVDGIDLLYTAWSYGSFFGWQGGENFTPSADFNWDATVSDDDLNMVLNNFGHYYHE